MEVFNMLTSARSMKVIGKNGQLSLGKVFAGRLAEMEYFAPGRFVINLGTFTPDFEAAYFTEEDHNKIEAAIKSLTKTKPVETDLKAFESLLGVPGNT
jgi:hypothetical protein